jgi:hypothetical protein
MLAAFLKYACLTLATVWERVDKRSNNIPEHLWTINFSQFKLVSYITDPIQYAGFREY